MSDKTIFGCAETGAYQTSAPNPHIDLSGTASSSYSIAQLFADAMSTDETATVSIIKDKDNWAVYGGAKFTNDTVDTLDLSVATLLESKGTLSDEDGVTCLGLAPGQRGVSYAKVYRNASYNLQTSLTVIPFDTVESDIDGLWDAGNYRFIPKKPGLYLVKGFFRYPQAAVVSACYVYKNGELYDYSSHSFVSLIAHATSLVYCNGSTDYLQLTNYVVSSGKTIDTGPSGNNFIIVGPLAV